MSALAYECPACRHPNHIPIPKGLIIERPAALEQPEPPRSGKADANDAGASIPRTGVPVELRPPVEICPMDPLQIIGEAIDLVTRHFGKLFSLTAIVIVPMQIVSSLIVAAVVLQSFDLSTDGVPSGGDLFQIGLAVLFAGTLLFLAWLFATAATVKAVGDAHLGNEPDIGTSLRFATRKLSSLVWLAIVAVVMGYLISTGPIWFTNFLATFMGMPFLILFGVLGFILFALYLATSWIVCVPVLLIDDDRGWSALNRSRELVAPRLLQTLGVLVLGWLVGGAVSYGFSFFAQALFASGGLLNAFLGYAMSTMIPSIIVTPFFAAAITILYFDLRLRRFGTIDMEMLEQQAGLTGGQAFGADWNRPSAAVPARASTGPVTPAQPAAPPPPPKPKPRPMAPGARPQRPTQPEPPAPSE